MKNTNLIKRLLYSILILAPLLYVLGCTAADGRRLNEGSPDNTANNTGSSAKSPNILLMIGDDMGKESLSCFEIGKNTADTPTLDKLCADGVRFDNFWSQPICTPTRATLMTGRYGFRTGVGRPTGDKDALGYFPDPPPKPETAPYEPPRPFRPGRQNAPSDYGIQLNELTLPMLFKARHELGYATAAIGKWHIADTRNGWEKHPQIVGFDHFSGLIRGFPDSYFSWNKVVNGEWSGKTGYTPNDKAQDAIAWIDQQKDKPWFLWFAFNLPHTPLHVPPENLLNSDYSALDPKADPNDNPLPYFHAMLEAMDTQIAKILASLSPQERANTYVIFMGDNGSGRNVVTAPYRDTGAKATVYQGGVNVPLIVSGPGVKQGVSKALVNSTDLFSTITELAGIDAENILPKNLTLDSTSIVPYLNNPAADSIRQFVYTDLFGGNFAGIEKANFAMRNHRYKILRHQGNFEFYDLQVDPYENNDLLKGELSPAEKLEYENLLQQVTALRANK